MAVARIHYGVAKVRSAQGSDARGLLSPAPGWRDIFKLQIMVINAAPYTCGARSTSIPIILSILSERVPDITHGKRTSYG